jgi:DNA polymerase III subunit beta
MKLICERDALHRSLRMVIGRARDRDKVGIAILNNVKLDAADNQMAVCATDLATRSEAHCSAEIEVTGSTTVPADRFARLVDLMPQGAQVSLQLKENELHVRCGRSSYHLPTLSADIFPQISELRNPIAFSLGCLDVKRLFGEPARVIASNRGRVYLEGGCLSCEKGDLIVTGTDALRLVRINLTSDARFDGRYIVPKAAMNEIVKLASEGEIAFRCSSNLIEVKTSQCVFTSKLIDSTYPDLTNIIPDPSQTFITVAREEFTVALTRLSGMANEFSSINLEWKDGEDHIDMSVSGDGTGSEYVGCESTHQPGRIAFSPSILSDVIDVFRGELLQLHVRSAQESMRIIDPDAPDLLVLAWPCMPRSAAHGETAQ